MQVLVTKPIHPDATERLTQEAEVVLPQTAHQILAALPQVDAIILRGGFSMGADEMDRARKLQVIGRHGVGLDNVDLEAASARGIPVTYTPYGPTESTAEHAFALMLATARRIPQVDRAVRNGVFEIQHDPQAMGYELQGKALGIVGFGRIGRRVASMCRAALDMDIYVYDPYLTAEQAQEWGATLIQDLVQLARTADVLSIHTPLTAETHHLVSKDVIAALKPSAILINASRGPVVDQAALTAALAQGRIAGAGLDVYDPEPPAPDDPLFCLDRVVLTPHIGSFTYESRRLMGLTVVEDILSALKGERPRYLANPLIWEHRRTGSA
jgi:D-3-phosphoglycerate dehydrogenase